MKVLYQEGPYVIGILDDQNYTCHDSRRDVTYFCKKADRELVRHRYSFYNTPHQAVREAHRLIANKQSTDLQSWHSTMKAQWESYNKLLEAPVVS